MLSSILLPRISINRAAAKDPVYFLPTDIKGYCVIPDWVEEKLQHWEDPIIKVTQRCFLNIVSLLLNRLATSLTSVELMVMLPVMFLTLGKDLIALISFCYITSLLVTAQLTKRLIWRYRPYMVSRAVMASQDRSSSFPSLTVSCTLVYLYMFCEVWHTILNNAQHPDESTTLSLFLYLPMFIIAVLVIVVVSCVKIAVGANYPSDCVFGLLQGIFVCYTGNLLYAYSKMFSVHHLGSHSFLIPYKSLDWSMMWTWSTAGILIVIICSLPQVMIMKHIHRVTGVLLPCCTLLTMICGNHHVIRNTHHDFDARMIVIATFMWSVIMGVSNYMKPTRWWSRVLSYITLHSITLTVLLLWKVPHK